MATTTKNSTNHKTTKVKAHTRVVDGKVIQVEAHDREIEDFEDFESSEDYELAGEDSVKSTSRRKQQDAWEAWNSAGRPESQLPGLMRMFDKTLSYKKSVYAKNVRIPEDAIELQLQILLKKAIYSYDPSKGASLNTHVVNNLHGIQRWIGENQNIGRIPENRLYKIRLYKETVSSLGEDLGRQPTDTEVAKRLEWSVKEVERMRREQRADLYTQGFDDDPTNYVPSTTLTLLYNFSSELSGDERKLFDYLIGRDCVQETSTNKLAKLLGKEPFQISRMRNKISDKLQPYLDDLEVTGIGVSDSSDSEMDDE